MPAKKSTVDAALQELYDQVPTIACKGLCHYACTSIDTSLRERRRMRAAGVTLPTFQDMKELNATTDEYRCPALSQQGSCTVYELRPMICRVWGVSPAVPCPHDCEIDGEPLSAVQMVELIAASFAVGGHPRIGPAELEELRARIADPAERERLTDGAMAHVRAVGNEPGPWVRVVFDKS